MIGLGSAKVAFDGSLGFLQVVADKLRGESWPGCKETYVNSLDPSAGDGAETSFVEVCDNVTLVLDFVDIVGLGWCNDWGW